MDIMNLNLFTKELERSKFIQKNELVRLNSYELIYILINFTRFGALLVCISHARL